MLEEPIEAKASRGPLTGVGCMVLGVVAIVWGGAVGYLGVLSIVRYHDPWDAWIGYFVTFLMMAGLGVLAIAWGIDERRGGPESRATSAGEEE